MTPSELIAAFEAVAEAPEGATRLRELILQLAIRGRLVLSDPDDEPAPLLLERIAVDRARLVEDGGISGRRFAPVSGDEQPVAIPGKWAWARLGEVAHDLGQTVPAAPFSYIDVGSVDNRRGVVSADLSIIDAAKAPSRARKIVKPGTVIYSTVRPYLLNVAVVDREYSPSPIASTAFAVLHPHVGVESRLLFWWLRSPIFSDYVSARMKGVAYPAINDASLLAAPIPLPPSTEQRRIVTRVEELMGLLDRLEAARTKRETTRAAARDSVLASLREADSPEAVDATWTRFAQRMDDLLCDPADIAPLRQAVLQLAIRGRLVRQDPKDDPASELLEHLASEKASLENHGRSARGKPASPVSAGDQPFELPGSWVWCRLGDLLVDGPTNGWSPTTVEHETGVRTLKLSATTSGLFDGRCFKFVDAKLDPDSPLWLRPGDLLIQRSNTPEYVGMAAVYRGATQTFIYPDLMMRCRLATSVSVEYIHAALLAPMSRRWFGKKASGTSASMVKLNQAAVRATMIPLPPLAEQRRIVARVEELMALLDRLEHRLTNSQRVQAMLAAAAVHHAVT